MQRSLDKCANPPPELRSNTAQAPSSQRLPLPPSRLPKQLLADHRAVDAAYDRIPKALRDTLFPFQRDGVKFVIRRGGRALVGDEMGLGKTLQARAS